ncbi:MAG: hypothetical protein NZ989_01990 [Bacteroidia bacterium]|nr:hypothetical protein [Bacteroidia bacterium]
MTSLRNLRLRLNGSSQQMKTPEKEHVGKPTYVIGGKWFFLLIAGLIEAQSVTPFPEVYDAIRRGLTIRAQQLLERAREHPDSLVRQEAALLQGYVALLGGREKDALREWYYLSQRSPSSPLGMEASFWRADLLLRYRDTWPGALYILRSLLENPHTPADLRAAVEHRLEHFFWREADLGTLWTYAIEGAPALYPYILPPLFYNLRQSCQWEVWRLWESISQNTCGELPDSLRVDSLFRDRGPDTLRVVLLLPLMAMQERSSPFLEFWQGFELGLSESLSPYTVWEVQVEDSERNLQRVQGLLSEWEKNPPHILVGEVSWTLNQTISAFCERKHIWHAIPINPAYPSRATSIPLAIPAQCIGWQMAEATNSLVGRGVLFYTAEDPLVKSLIEGFQRRRWVPAYELPANLSELTRRWGALRDSIGAIEWCGLFVSQDELLSYLLLTLNREAKPPLILGLESWLNLKLTNIADYKKLRIWIPQTFLADSSEWNAFSQKLRQRYAHRGTFFHAQGYDAALFLAALSKEYDPLRVPDKEVKGLLNIYTYPPACGRYRLLIWEYEGGESHPRHGP